MKQTREALDTWALVLSEIIAGASSGGRLEKLRERALTFVTTLAWLEKLDASANGTEASNVLDFAKPRAS